MGRYQHCLIVDLSLANNPRCKRRIRLGDRVICDPGDLDSYSSSFNSTGIAGEVVGFGPGSSPSETLITVRFDSEVGGWEYGPAFPICTRDPAELLPGEQSFLDSMGAPDLPPPEPMSPRC